MSIQLARGPKGARLIIGATLLFVMAVIAMVPAATDDVIADHVFGQSNLNLGNEMIFSVHGMSQVQGVAIDSSSTPHHLYVSDTANHRILGYYDAATLTNGQPLNLAATPPDILRPRQFYLRFL
jgi:hypothetical protein